MSRWTLAIIFCIAGILRFGAVMNRPSTGDVDERVTIQRADFPTLAEVVENLGPSGRKQTAYYVLVHALTRLFPRTIETVRLLSAFAGTLSIVAFYLLASRFLDRGTGILAAALLSVSQYHLHWSATGRVYAILVLATICSAYSLLLLFDGIKARWRFLPLYIASSAILMYLHYFGIMMVALQIAGVFVLALRRRAWHVAALGLLAAGALAMLYLPLVPTLVRDAGGAAGLDWLRRPQSPAEILILFGIYLQRFAPASITGGVLFILVATLAIRVASRRGQVAKVLALLGWILCPILFSYLFSLYAYPILHPRYTIISLAPILLLLAYVIRHLVGPRRSGLVSLAVVAWQLTLLATSPIGPWEYEIMQLKAFGRSKLP